MGTVSRIGLPGSIDALFEQGIQRIEQAVAGREKYTGARHTAQKQVVAPPSWSL
jgi:hypothetical protein